MEALQKWRVEPVPRPLEEFSVVSSGAKAESIQSAARSARILEFQDFLNQKEAPNHKVAMARAGMAGVVATAVDWTAVLLLKEFVGAHYMVGVVLGAIMGGLTNFIINKFWSFQNGSGSTKSQLLKYAAAWGGFLVLYNGLVALLTEGLMLHYFGSVVLASIVVFLGWSYPMQRWFVFSRTKPTGA